MYILRTTGHAFAVSVLSDGSPLVVEQDGMRVEPATSTGLMEACGEVSNFFKKGKVQFGYSCFNFGENKSEL
jgi:hypothetical protein